MRHELIVLLEKSLPYLAGILGTIFAWRQWVHFSREQDIEYYRKKWRAAEKEMELINQKLQAEEVKKKKLKRKNTTLRYRAKFLSPKFNIFKKRRNNK